MLCSVCKHERPKRFDRMDEWIPKAKHFLKMKLEAVELVHREDKETLSKARVKIYAQLKVNILFMIGCSWLISCL